MDTLGKHRRNNRRKKDEVIKEAINIARTEGILIGLSSGAVVAGYKKILKEQGLDKGDYILILPDHRYKYIEQYNEYLAKEQ